MATFHKEILDNLDSRDSREYVEIPEILESSQRVESKGQSDRFLQILENVKILEVQRLL